MSGKGHSRTWSSAAAATIEGVSELVTTGTGTGETVDPADWFAATSEEVALRKAAGQ